MHRPHPHGTVRAAPHRRLALAAAAVLALAGTAAPLEGVQFHPESVLTEGGHHMLANWLTECGDSQALSKSIGLAPVVGS